MSISQPLQKSVVQLAENCCKTKTETEDIHFTTNLNNPLVANQLTVAVSKHIEEY
ncbi:hypothetical protein SAMD00079811_76280 (plasmid) [Scytonema sp. HK-05]|nr:hypothetical protein SAMD00079811_76280 [Scytonema sp. HK-05]